ncbi:winged helix DNA-binding domain-containing protein [Actinoplanes sp. CA-030573]|uniref:winged helix DNA-binding domain-containing protein n=1 Tax=Actinoplanes sp. CA-030573 TaxID=3239898 RepID=UPI003D92E2F5
MRVVTDDERRARLAVRHALAPAHRVTTPEAATRAMTVLHSTEPATVYLSLWARKEAQDNQADVREIQRALYTERTLVKQLAMRRTLFVFPRDLLPAVWPSASARVATSERAAITKDAGPGWLDRARAEVLTLLAGHPGGLSATEIRRALPRLDLRVTVTRILVHLGATADIVRGENTTGWHNSRPRWTLMRYWLGEVPDPLDPAAGYRELVRRWLHSFGPGTEDDIVWWLGATKSVVRAALAGLEAVPVGLHGGQTGWLLPGDVDEVADPGPWVALLPVLDPTTMGWKGRDFYLGPHRGALFDRSGNAGTTAWADGRVVGCWVQDGDGAVRVRLLEKVSDRAREALDAEADRLTAWLDGFRVPSGWVSPAMRAEAGIG